MSTLDLTQRSRNGWFVNAVMAFKRILNCTVEAIKMTDVGNEALDLLDIGEVADRLRCSKSTVRRLIASGDLEAVHLGALVRIAPEAVLEYKGILRSRAQEMQGNRSAAAGNAA